MKTKSSVLKDAVDYAGGQTAFARLVSQFLPKPISQKHVWNWLYRDRRIAAEYCLPIETATQGAVKASMLRPDLWGK